MSGKTKNQHYVPQMYLNRFASGGEKLCVWKLETNQILENQNSRNYAAKRYFYDADKAKLNELAAEMASIHPEINNVIESEDVQFIEKGLCRAEGDASFVIDSIIQDHSQIYDRAIMQKLIIFVHDLAYRTERFRKQIENTKMSSMRSKVESDTLMKIKTAGRDTQLYQLLGIEPLIKTAHMLVENYNWYIGIVEGSSKLLISDNPAQGIMMGFNDICIPLCAEKAVIFRMHNPAAPYLSNDEPVNNEIFLSDRSVFAYNAIQLSYANRFMFGDKENLDFLKRMKERQESFGGSF